MKDTDTPRNEAEEKHFNYDSDKPEPKEIKVWQDGEMKDFIFATIDQKFDYLAAVRNGFQVTLVADIELAEYIMKTYKRGVYSGNISIYDLSDPDDLGELNDNFAG